MWLEVLFFQGCGGLGRVHNFKLYLSRNEKRKRSKNREEELRIRKAMVKQTWKQDVRLAKLTQPHMVHIQSDGTMMLLWLLWPDFTALSWPNCPPAPPVGLLLKDNRIQRGNYHEARNIPYGCHVKIGCIAFSLQYC